MAVAVSFTWSTALSCSCNGALAVGQTVFTWKLSTVVFYVCFQSSWSTVINNHLLVTSSVSSLACNYLLIPHQNERKTCKMLVKTQDNVLKSPFGFVRLEVPVDAHKRKMTPTGRPGGVKVRAACWWKAGECVAAAGVFQLSGAPSHLLLCVILSLHPSFTPSRAPPPFALWLIPLLFLLTIFFFLLF